MKNVDIEYRLARLERVVYVLVGVTAGRAYRLYPLEQITFATAWPTMVWRGVR